MAISRKEIEHIASLARLDSTGGIFDRLADDMQGIVAMVDKLAELDLGDITDVINTERKNAFHEDEVIQEFTPDELIDRMHRLPVRRRSSSACCRVRRGQESWHFTKKLRPSCPSCSAKRKSPQ